MIERFDYSGLDGEMLPSKYGDWVPYDDVEEIAERLQVVLNAISVEFSGICTPNQLAIVNELTSIINEIRGKE